MMAIILVMLALFIPNLACMARRFHDQDLSGWLILLSFIPYVGSLIIIVFMCIRGTDGPNRSAPTHLGTSAISKASSPEALPRATRVAS